MSADGSPGLDWQRDGRDWPNRQASRFVVAGGLRWHVQRLGAGPPLLLLHGTGAATHSWRALAPLLAAEFTVVAPDLPGHGFSAPLRGGQPSLPAMCTALGALLAALEVTPETLVGHSAGAAIAVRLALDGVATPHSIVSLNGALLPWLGLPGALFSPIARLMSATPFVSRLFAQRAASPAAVARLVASTGSTLDAAGVELYGRLLRNPAHVAGALAMMANWDLARLERELPGLETPLTLVVGECDRTLPPSEARRVQRLLPRAELISLPGLGHLAHEEEPARAAAIILRAARAAATPRRRR